MNLKAVIVCFFSVVSLVAEASGTKRKWLVTLLVISVILSAVPTIAGLIEYFISPRSKLRRLKYAFYQLVMDDSFPVWERKRRLRGESIYCHQGYGTTVNCVHKNHLLVGSGGDFIVDIPNETVKNLKISYLVHNEQAQKRFITANASLSVLSRDVQEQGHVILNTGEYHYSHHKVTYFVDVKPDTWDSISQVETLKMKQEISVGDLNVTFGFLHVGQGLQLIPCVEDDTAITIRMKGVSKVLWISKPQWGFQEALRFMSYLAYWEKRGCCGVLSTVPFARAFAETMVMNICTVQDLIELAESGQQLTRYVTGWNCIIEGDASWKSRKKMKSSASDVGVESTLSEHMTLGMLQGIRADEGQNSRGVAGTAEQGVPREEIQADEGYEV